MNSPLTAIVVLHYRVVAKMALEILVHHVHHVQGSTMMVGEPTVEVFF